jgi:DNA invertase Pin-like site-specific DNA recombinase
MRAFGASLDRPALQELLIQFRMGQINAIAVQRLDRLSRRVSRCAGILDEFPRAGVEVLIAEFPESANGASGRLLTNLFSSFAEFERDITSNRIPAASRMELVNPDDLLGETVRRRAVFEWLDTNRAGRSSQ